MEDMDLTLMTYSANSLGVEDHSEGVAVDIVNNSNSTLVVAVVDRNNNSSMEATNNNSNNK